jgi:NADP-dependent 3-hydroxy acid dehydrogenase YdfG
MLDADEVAAAVVWAVMRPAGTAVRAIAMERA